MTWMNQPKNRPDLRSGPPFKDPACGGCIYFGDNGDGTGVCRRYPPGDMQWSWVTAQDWCGEFIKL